MLTGAGKDLYPEINVVLELILIIKDCGSERMVTFLGFPATEKVRTI